jgi:hypothetical protein
MRTWIVVVLLAGCGGAPAPTESPATAGPTCSGAAEHVVDAMVATMDPRPPDEAVNKLIKLIRVRCEADQWTAAARSCLAQMRSAADADRCGTLLTEAQQAALVRDQEASPALATPTGE